MIEESNWTTWFWLGIIVLTISSVAAVAGFLVYALWKGM